MNELQETKEREIIHVITPLTCVLNDYDEVEDHNVVIISDDRENGHVISFVCPPATAQVFVVGKEYQVDIGILI